MPPDIADDPAFEDVIELGEDGEFKMLVNEEKVSEVDLRDPLEFEDELLDGLVTDDLGGSFGAGVPLKGFWIHGWLEEKGEDYINNMYRNWLFFAQYISQRTDQFINTSEYNIRKGSYKSMHRYIVILEDLGLVERTRIVDINQSEYDQFVPGPIRRRRFVEITTPIEDAPEEWAGPTSALYGEPDKDEQKDDEQSTDTDSDTDTQTSDEPNVIASDSAAITEYQRLDELRNEIEDKFFDFVEQIFKKTDADLVEGAVPSDFALEKFIVYGEWVTEEATFEDELNALVSIDQSLAERKVGFLPDSLATLYATYIEREFAFKQVNITGGYADRQFTRLDKTMEDQDIENRSVRYDLLDDSIEVIEE